MLSSVLHYIYPTHARRDACEYFIRDGAKPLGQLGYGEGRTEDLYAVALATGYICDINHAHIHTDITYIGSFMPIHDAVPYPIASATIEPVSIAYGQ